VGVRRVLLSPRWLAGHLLALACTLGFLWLGWWQWDRAQQAGGGAQNLGYAMQWPLFAVFVLYAWTKIVRLERDRLSGVGHPSAPPPEPATDLTGGWRREPSRPPDAGGTARPGGAASPGSTGDPGGTAREAGGHPGTPMDEDDEELAAYNRYLAELAARDRQR